MFYMIMIILFLKPSFKKEYMKEQIFRGSLGFVVSFILFYIFNMDRSISFLISAIWIPALFQIIFATVNTFVERKKETTKDKKENLFLSTMIILIIGSMVYNGYPYVIGQSKNLAKMVNLKESNDKISKINAEHVIIISPETAYYEMQKMLGTLPNPSIYKIGELGITSTKNGTCYVAPIEIDGLLRAFTNKEIPGVIYVSAEKTEEAKIINIPVKYAESFALNKKLERHLRKYKKNAVLFQANAELDYEGNPYYVGSYGHYKYGRKGPVIDGVLLMSFKDGQVLDYNKDKVPNWVDEIYPSDVSEEYNEYFGTLGKGWLNKKISKKGVHIPTRWKSGAKVEGLLINSNEVTGVVDADGEMKWFTDHTNTSEASTTMTGYSLMNMRTGEMTYYKTPGYINGKGAMNAVDKALGANKANWAPVQPLFYNLFGSEAWVVPVVNKVDGALIKVAIVAAENGYVVLEDNKASAIESFKNAIAYGKINSTDKNANSVKADEKTISGKVQRINSISENGNTVFYIKLENNNNLFMVTKSAGVNIVLTKESDEVEIKYMDIKDNNIVSVTKFTNKSVK